MRSTNPDPPGAIDLDAMGFVDEDLNSPRGVDDVPPARRTAGPAGPARPARAARPSSTVRDGRAIDMDTMEEYDAVPAKRTQKTARTAKLNRAHRQSTRRVVDRARKKQIAAEKAAKQGISKQYNAPLPEPKRDEDDLKSCSARFWKPFPRFCTLLIPSCLICKDGDAAKRAWREKVTIFEIMVIFNLLFMFLFGVIPLYFCRDLNEPTTPLHDYEWYKTVLEPTCTVLNYLTFGILFFTAFLLLLQCLCSLIVGCQSMHARYLLKKGQMQRRASDEESPPDGSQDPVVGILVPCYNEGEHELRKTIKSIVNTDYTSENKVMIVIADGIITGKGEFMNTPKHLASILGFSVSRKDRGYAYHGCKENRASIYPGTYYMGGKTLKYIVIVKRGLPDEKDSAKPGNRGKRDSQLIAMGLFNRIHHDRKLSELDNAIYSALNDLEVPATEIEYMLAIDADTRISESSITYMIQRMERDQKVLACCGETKVDNKTSSWVTMIQVYEYFASHHLKKSFESVFGCVTCLPGCFTMYRMYTADDLRPLLSNDAIYQTYSRNDIESLHEKNLYHLGEDRMLTTLLLQHFSDMKLSFVPIAACWTIVPDTFKVLLSQRRRWINSTYHNMWELLKVKTLCGICCCSMKFVVALDMLSTMILPTAFIYTYFFIVMVILDPNARTISLVTLILYGVIFGCQMLIFLGRGRLDYILWFFFYLLFGLPVFFFVLPIYSFWNMDDLSWGTTRQVAAKTPSKKK